MQPIKKAGLFQGRLFKSVYRNITRQKNCFPGDLDSHTAFAVRRMLPERSVPGLQQWAAGVVADVNVS
jgi:hypothetical protein